MAHDLLLLHARATTLGNKVLSVALVFFVYLSLVGLVPFAEREAMTLDETGAGTLARQIALIAIAALFAWAALQTRLPLLLRMISLPMALTLGWCAATITWSPVPDIAFRRFAFTAIVFFIVFSAVSTLGPQRIFRLLALTLFVLVVASLVSVLVVPDAIHQVGDPEPSVVGDWRGVFYHKNKAGFAAAVSIILAIHFYAVERRFHWLVAIFSSIALLVLSNSKTSMAFVAPAVAMGYVVGPMTRTRARQTLLLALIFVGLTTVGALCAIFSHDISLILSEPESFTGRAKIWQTIREMLRAHWAFGYGFGSIYGVGLETPMAPYARGWMLLISHGHNGYLDVTLHTGVIGLVLTLTAFVAQPLANLLYRSNAIPQRYPALLVSLICLVLLHDMLESNLLDRDRAPWIVLLIAVASIRYWTSQKAASSRFVGTQSRL